MPPVAQHSLTSWPTTSSTITPAPPSAADRSAASVAAWPAADLEERVIRALDFAEVVVRDFGETGYTDVERPALGFGAEKVVAGAAMLAYVAHGASSSTILRDRVDSLACRLEPLVRSRRALADLTLNPDRVFRRAVPHVLLTVLGLADDGFDAIVADRCARTLAHASDQPATVHAERRWITNIWDRDLGVAGVPLDTSISGTALSAPFDVIAGSREDPYGLTHLLFYVSDFGRCAPIGLGRSRAAILADVEALVIRYLGQGDYDLVGELLMAWPQLRTPWSPTAAFAFRVLAEVDDEVGMLPCGNVDPERLATLTGAARTRYARATSYHTAFVMGFLCAAALRAGETPPTVVAGPDFPQEAGRSLLAIIPDGPADWRLVLEGRTPAEKRALTPMLCGLAISEALRARDFATVDTALSLATRYGLPATPLRSAATDLLHALGAASLGRL